MQKANTVRGRGIARGMDRLTTLSEDILKLMLRPMDACSIVALTSTCSQLRSLRSNTDAILGNTALMRATIHGHIETARLLLDSGANVNYKRKDGDTALLIAIEKNQAEIVQLLLDRGARVPDQDDLMEEEEEEDSDDDDSEMSPRTRDELERIIIGRR